MSAAESQELLGQFEAGESAAERIFDRYVERLVALAAARLAPSMRRRIDAEDVVQSAYRSFFVHAREGEYRLGREGDLWRLLASITLHKLHRQVERHTAGRRDVRRERDCVVAGDGAAVGFAPVARQPGAADVIAVVEQIALVAQRLRPAQRVVFEKRLAGRSAEEIAKELGRSLRTVRRLLDETRAEVERELTRRPDEPAPLAAPATTLPDLSWSNFVLEALVGRGGMGKVYRARLKLDGPRVAIKTLHKRRQTDPIAVERFLAEARVLSRLSHPSIVGIRGIGQFPGGGYFLVLDLVDGTNLEERIRAGGVPIVEAVRIVLAIARAVAFAHDHGVVHADLKPANILIDELAKVYVSDFGFARLLPAAGAVEPLAFGRGGTLAYMAPELWGVSPAPATIAADIYGLGGILYSLLTGEPPNRITGARKPKWKPAAGVRRRRRDVPRPLAAICDKCLSERAVDRFPSAHAVVAELSALNPPSVE
jgi:RNA polymerase sigma factor (sigma-70 family)